MTEDKSKRIWKGRVIVLIQKKEEGMADRQP